MSDLASIRRRVFSDRSEKEDTIRRLVFSSSSEKEDILQEWSNAGGGKFTRDAKRNQSFAADGRKAGPDDDPFGKDLDMSRLQAAARLSGGQAARNLPPEIQPEPTRIPAPAPTRKPVLSASAPQVTHPPPPPRVQQPPRLMDGAPKFTGVKVKKLGCTVDEEALRAVFSMFGPISSVFLSRDASGKSLGRGIVYFQDPEDAAMAVERMQDHRHGDLCWGVEPALRKAPKGAVHGETDSGQRRLENPRLTAGSDRRRAHCLQSDTMVVGQQIQETGVQPAAESSKADTSGSCRPAPGLTPPRKPVLKLLDWYSAKSPPKQGNFSNARESPGNILDMLLRPSAGSQTGAVEDPSHFPGNHIWPICRAFIQSLK